MQISSLAFFCFIAAAFVVTNAHVNAKAIKRILDSHSSELAAVVPATASTASTTTPAAIRTDGDCVRTNYNRRFWDQVGGTSTKLIGNWYGSGNVRIMDKATGNVYISLPLTSIWNVTFNDALGRIDWVDITSSGGVTMAPDTFHRYLTQGGVLNSGWYSCTNLDDSSTAGSIDRELDVFGLDTSYSVLTTKQGGVEQSGCTYHFDTASYNTNSVGCTYYDTLGSFVPPGLTVQYYIRMLKN